MRAQSSLPFFSGLVFSKTVLGVLCLILFCCLPRATTAQETGSLDWLTTEERQFLIDHPTIRIAPTPSYPPFEYWSSDNRLQGVVVSYLEQFEKELGIQFEKVKTASWDENLEKLRQREIDAVSLIVPWTDRDYVAVSEPYISYPSMIFVQKSEMRDLSLKDLSGKRVAVPDSYTGEAFLRRNYPDIIVVEARDPAHGVRMLSTGEVDAFFGGAGVVAYTAQREGIANIRVAGESDFQYRNGLGVRSDWEIFANIITKTLKRITPAMHSEFHARWVSAGYFRKRFYEYREFWWSMGGLAAFLLIGTFGMAIWNRKQAAFIDQLELEQSKTEQARREAEAANEAKSLFVATISHEIRTPMNGVLGMCELLRRTELNDRQTEFLNYASGSAEHLVGLINDILDFSKMEAGKLTFDPQPFSLNNLIDDVISLMRTQTDAKGLTLIEHRSPELGDAYVGDEMRIRQILVNLIGNAIKFTSEGEIAITVSPADPPATIPAGPDGAATPDSITLPIAPIRLMGGADDDLDNESLDLNSSFEFSPEAELIRFDVADTGIGIAPDKLDDIFRPFEQEQTGTARQFGGTGLGLSICRMLAQTMGGSTEVQSELGKGSVFSFSVLVDPTEQVIENTASTPHDGPSESDKHQVPRYVLLAEDGIVNQKVAVGLLELHGHRIDVVDNGVDALAAMKQNHYDAILMDIEMPKMNGVETIKAFRRWEQQQPDPKEQREWVVALTGHAMLGDRERFLNAGFDAHLVKPFRPQELFSVIERGPVDLQRATTLSQIDSLPLRLDDSNEPRKNIAPVESVSPAETRPPDQAHQDRARSSAVLDRGLALERTGGDAKLARVLLETCIDDVPKLLKMAREGVQAADFVSARRCGHSLRTSFANVGAIRAAESAKALEFCQQEFASAFEARIDAVEAEFLQLKQDAELAERA